MEQITRSGETILYGTSCCVDIEDAYRRFREDYHSSLGRRRNRRLNNLGTRKERMHGWGMYMDNVSLPTPEYMEVRVPSRLMGIVATGYCRSIGSWDIPDMDEDSLGRYMDWLCCHGNRNLRLVGRKDKSGRTRKQR